MDAIKIERGVEAPAKHKYPWADMKVGDSFYVKGATTVQLCVASRHRKLMGEKYTTRRENGGARIWRIA